MHRQLIPGRFSQGLHPCVGKILVLFARTSKSQCTSSLLYSTLDLNKWCHVPGMKHAPSNCYMHLITRCA